MNTDLYRNKKILIVGGTGTIGNHLLRRLIQSNPAVIRIFSRDEHKQFELQQTMSEYTNIRYLIGDIRDYSRVERAMEDIDYVFHLAAMKHVPACEYNPFEAVQTNIIGTQNIIQAALQTGVQKVLFTSTDKAISPTNTYGATKLTAERLMSAAEFQKGPKRTVFCSVRFGNVMGSRGSVIPLFKRQILENGRVFVTDPDMKRYMMSPTQAINLILAANEKAEGGEVFVLKMPVIRLGDLAEVMIEEVSRKYGKNKETIKIEVIGLRPGEKMFEELMTEEEARICRDDKDMFVLPPLGGVDLQKWPRQSTFLLSAKDERPVSKEMIRTWILEEGLI